VLLCCGNEKIIVPLPELGKGHIVMALRVRRGMAARDINRNTSLLGNRATRDSKFMACVCQRL
jgi:hypothetical protein